MSNSSILDRFVYWNRRLHIHIGLFLLLFIWLFSISGLLLNHYDWAFAKFWEDKKESTTVSKLTIPRGLDSIQTIQAVMLKLDIAGEVSNVKMNPDSVDFQVSKPGHVRNLHVDFNKKICIQKEMKYNVWGKIKTLHTFNGSKGNNSGEQGNWLITQIWKFSMDAIALGLIYLSLSSWIMWYRIRKSYRWGSLSLAAGSVLVAYFLIGLTL